MTRPVEFDPALVSCLLSESPGIRLSPDHDGEVEIPRSIVRAMDWKENETLLLYRPLGYVGLVITAAPVVPRLAYQYVGYAIVSRQARMPLPSSIMEKAEMDGMDLVVVPEGNRVVVRPDLRAFRKQIGAVCSMMRRHLPQHVCGAFADILSGRKSMLDEKQECLTGEAAVQDGSPMEIAVTVSLDEPEPPTLAMPAPGRPLVARIIGNPYQFRTHWMARPDGDGKGQLALCGSPCAVCEQRKPDTLWLAPALVREAGIMQPGFILAQTALIRKIARALKDKDRDRTDIIVYHRPWNEGMCAVHTNPPEDLPAQDISMARLACAHPDVFLAAAFREANDIQGVPKRPPMLMSANHMEFVPDLTAAAAAVKTASGAWNEEALLDKIIDDIETGKAI